MCGGDASRSIARASWTSAGSVGQNRAKYRLSDRICEPCVMVHARFSAVPGRPPKEGKTEGGRWSNYSVLVEVVGENVLLTTATKGEKPAIRKWLQAPKQGPWFAAIAESGQKHLLSSVPMNAAGGRGRALFEETLVELPGSLLLIDAIDAALTAGLSKESLDSGDYTVNQWKDCATVIEDFERGFSGERGSPWFALALFLGQRNEEEYDARRKERSTKTDRAPVARGAAGDAVSRSEPAEALGPAAGPSVDSKPDDGDAPRMVCGTVQAPLPASGGQLDLFGLGCPAAPGGAIRATVGRGNSAAGSGSNRAMPRGRGRQKGSPHE